MKYLTLAAIFLLFSTAFASYLYFSGNAEYLVLKKGVTLEVNGTPVRGEMLSGRAIAIVTRRDAGKEHSFQLFFAGDVDMKGDMGSVADCNQWVAPNLPLLIVTRHYPPCDNRRDARVIRLMGPLMDRGVLHFTARDKSIIQIDWQPN